MCTRSSDLHALNGNDDNDDGDNDDNHDDDDNDVITILAREPSCQY